MKKLNIQPGDCFYDEDGDIMMLVYTNSLEYSAVILRKKNDQSSLSGAFDVGVVIDPGYFTPVKKIPRIFTGPWPKGNPI